MKTIIRLTLLTTLLCLLALPIAAQDEDITIVMWNWSQEQEEFYDDLAEAYKEEYPNVTIDWQTRALPQHDEALPLAFASDQAPDVYFYSGDPMLNLTELLDLSWVQPIQNLPEDWTSRWGPGSFAEGVTHIGDDYYSFPLQDSAIWGFGYLFYNKDILREAGLDPEAPPATRSEWLEMCQTIVDNTGSYCLSNPMQPARELSRLFQPLTGRAYTDLFFDYQAGRYNIDDPRHLDSVAFIQTLYENDYVLPGVYDKATARAAMGAGQVAFYSGGTWIPSVLNGMGFEDTDLGMAIMPTPDEGATGSLNQNPLGSVKVFISSITPHPVEASQFIEWLTRPEGFYAQNYVNRGFGTLAFADMSNVQDEALAALAAIEAANADMKIVNPQPLLACPEVSGSQAQIVVNQIRPDWVYEEMQLAIVEGRDFAEVAGEIAAEQNRVFLEELEKEGISPDCFTFPQWDFVTDFTADMYTMDVE